MDISNENVIDLLDKIIIVLKNQDVSREQDVAIQRLEEAVFWLTYGTEE